MRLSLIGREPANAPVWPWEIAYINLLSNQAASEKVDTGVDVGSLFGDFSKSKTGLIKCYVD